MYGYALKYPYINIFSNETKKTRENLPPPTKNSGIVYWCSRGGSWWYLRYLVRYWT